VCTLNTLQIEKLNHTGSNPDLTSMSKRYSESSNQDLKNDSAECLRREWDIVGTKEDTQLLPVVLDVFMGMSRRFLRNRKPN
jgi:hypothetical protein